MKKIILMLLFAAVGLMAVAQSGKYKVKNGHIKRKAPSTVIQSYQKDYPTYYNNNTTWEWRNNAWHTRYRDTDHNNRNVDVYYDNNGNRVVTESDWDNDDVPATLRDKIKTSYNTQNYKVYRIDRPTTGTVYRVSLNGKRYYYDENGNIVSYKYSY
jgi:hypothetical protein